MERDIIKPYLGHAKTKDDKYQVFCAVYLTFILHFQLFISIFRYSFWQNCDF
jgi:hypothetical protein